LIRLLKIAYRVFALSFYRDNMTLFVLVIGLGGGFMSGREHMALAQFFVSSPILLLVPVAVWIVYTLKISGHNTAMLKRSENTFLFDTIILPKSKQWILIGSIAFAQFAPAFFYALFLVAVAVGTQQMDSALQVAGYSLVLYWLIAFHLLYLLRHPNPDKKISTLVRLVNRSFRRPYFLLRLEWILRKQTWTFIGTKTFGVLLLLGTLLLYTTDDYDYRILAMTLAIISSIHAQLVYELHRFDNFHFSLVRQLPLSFLKRISSTCGTIAWMLVPEIIILFKFFPLTLPATIMLEGFFFMMGLAVCFYGYLYRRDLGTESAMRKVFLVSMVLIVIILFEVPLWLLATMSIAAGFYWMNKYYYWFEYEAETSSE